jgi:hypothetical protein
MTDPVAGTARAAAARLAGDYDGELPAEVEAALARREAGQSADAASVASLVVAVADLALGVYRNLRDWEDSPSAEVVAHGTRMVIRERYQKLPDGYERITEVVSQEVTRAFQPPG